jgi:sigma-B regulation protein RsbU (phosphoserine phosphatase)
MSLARSAPADAAPVAAASGDGVTRDASQRDAGHDRMHPMAPGLERARHAESITDFLTDGSLAALCDELGTLTGISVRLIDAHGQRIRQERDQAGRTWWRSEPAPPTAAGETQIPLVVDGATIGTLIAEPGNPALPSDARKRLENALRLVANTAGELCQFELELANRMKEVRALARLSALIVRAATPERVLEAALDSALDALGLDAGSIMVLKEEALGVSSQDEEDLALKVSRNLSRSWLDTPLPLSKEREFDKRALAGEVVAVEDLLKDPRVLLPEQVASEGLRSALHVGMVFKARPLGVLRLYGRDARVFDESDKRLLASIAHQAAVALEQARLLRFEKEEQRIQRQLQLAADVQRRMLPKQVPNVPKLDVAARYVPSFELGGDFYDFIELNGHVGIVVGDVVGKGIAAALLMAAVRASLRAHVQGVYDLDEVVSRVNEALCRDTRETEFASLWYGVIDPATLRITYCSAGHEPTIVIRVPTHRAPTPADMDELTIGGMVVGIDPSQRYQRGIYDLRPRDVLVAYTDGVVDANNFAGKRFGKARLRECLLRILAQDPAASAAKIADAVLWEVRQHAGLAPRTDDKTLVVARLG